MKQLFILLFIVLSSSFLFAQDFNKHSFALNLGGFHKTPTDQPYMWTEKAFHLAKHIGTTYRYSLSPRHILRFNVDYKNQKDWTREVSESGNNSKYNEFQTGIGYEFIIKKGKFEPYIGLDLIGLSSRSLNNSWFNAAYTNETINRFAYGASALFGLRYNASDKLAIGLETNAKYLFNKSRTEIVSSNYINYFPTINSFNFLEFNPISAITIKYSI